MNQTLMKDFFNTWKNLISFRKYDEWCELPETQEIFHNIKQEPEKICYDAKIMVSEEL